MPKNYSDSAMPTKKTGKTSFKVTTQPVRLPRAVASQNRKGVGR